MNKQFFVYFHCKPNGDPFYVGKGLMKRAYNLKPRNQHHRNVVMKYGTDNISVCLFPCESEESAFAKEVELIAKQRSEGFELTNMTDGGEGVSGLKHSPETIAKRAASLKAVFAERGKVNPPSQREAARRNALGNKNCVGRVLPEDHKRKISESLRGNTCALGHKMSEEGKARIGAAHKGKQYALGHKPSSEVRAEWSKKRKGKPWTAARRAAYEKRFNRSSI